MDYAKVAPVKKETGPKAGMLMITVTGPSATRANPKSGKKVLYAADVSAARAAVTRFVKHNSFTFDTALADGFVQGARKRPALASLSASTARAMPKARASFAASAPTVSHAPRSTLAGGGSPAADAEKPVSRGQLTPQQREISDSVLSGSNAFITGPAGTGKSFLLKYIRAQFEAKYGVAGVSVVAPTGVAALNVGGVTIHSWAGIGLGRGKADDLVAKVRSNNKALRNWTQCRVLIIDEISMLGSLLFSKLAAIGAAIRGIPQSFGGLQIVLFGDFYQLPPVGLGKFGEDFAFMSPAWRDLRVKTEILTKSIRQAGDPVFTAMLNDIRKGEASQQTFAELHHCHVSVKPLPTDGITPTKVMCVNKKVDEVNEARLATLPGAAVSIDCCDVVHRPGTEQGWELKLETQVSRRVPAKVQLKIGCQVVLLWNLDPENKLVNGSRGVVEGFEHVPRERLKDRVQPLFPTGVTCPRVRFDCGVTVVIQPKDQFTSVGGLGAMIRYQVPLRLAWAITVHKSQGMTLSRAEIEVADAFEAGQVYVALSRCVSLEGLWVSGGTLDHRCVIAHPSVKKFYEAP